MQLVAYGAQDTYLTGNPQITFFKIVYRRHTNFSMETIRQTINGDTNTDTTKENKSSVIISRNGDLLGQIYITSETKGITDGSELIKEVSIDIGGQEIDKQRKEWLQIWSELTIPEEKKLGYKNMIGCLNNNLNSTGDLGVSYIQIPLQFWFCRNPGLALPLIALQYHEVQLNFIYGMGAGVNANINVDCDYFYLDTDERRRFAQASHEYLIEQIQYQSLNDGKEQKLNFNHPIKEIIWTSSEDYINASLSLNGHERFEKQKKEYFQLRQPFDYHSAIPGYNIPVSEKTELLTTPVDTFIRKHATNENYLNNQKQAVTLVESSITFGNIENFISPVPENGNDISSPFKRFKLGDMISIVISTYPDPGRVGGDTQDPAIGTITSSKTSFHRVTGIDTNLKKITFLPEIINENGRLLINAVGDADTGDIFDRLYVYILGRVHHSESRCSKLMKNINVYSFSLRPEDHQPSGTCNFSRIDSARLITDASIGNNENVYAVNYNILRIMSGMGGVAYSN